MISLVIQSLSSQAVAYCGRVPVRCRGPVSCGDVLLPSGDDDGLAVALRAHRAHERRPASAWSLLSLGALRGPRGAPEDGSGDVTAVAVATGTRCGEDADGDEDGRGGGGLVDSVVTPPSMTAGVVCQLHSTAKAAGAVAGRRWCCCSALVLALLLMCCLCVPLGGPSRTTTILG